MTFIKVQEEEFRKKFRFIAYRRGYWSNTRDNGLIVLVDVDY